MNFKLTNNKWLFKTLNYAVPLELRNWTRLLLGKHPIEYRARWPEIAHLNLKQGEIVIDVGANVGDFVECCLAYQPWAFIHAFEPLPNAFKELQKKFSSYARVFTVNQAIGSKAGNLPIQVSRFSEASSFLNQATVLKDGLYGIDFSVTQELNVAVIRLDDYIGQMNVGRIRLLKIDTQGFELEVLKGAREYLPSIEYIYLEGAFKPLYENQPLVNDLQKFLRTENFSLERMCAFRTDADGDLLECDMLFKNKQIGR